MDTTTANANIARPMAGRSTGVPAGALTGTSAGGDEPSATSGVSWAAIFAGAAGAAVLSLVLMVLGTGLGLSAVSPWSGQGMGSVGFGLSTVLWLTFTQLAASGIGGYLAGRLRTRWVSMHTDEVYFRDTAHGFLAWAVATLVTAGLLASAVGSVVSGGAQAGATMLGGAASAATTAATSAAGAAAGKGDASGGNASGSASGVLGYYVDSMFRPGASAQTGATPAAPAPNDDPARSTAEVSRILANAVATGSLPPQDTSYLGQLVSQRTGLAPADAQKRVTDTYAVMQSKAKDAEAAARDAADKARKASSYAALWLVVSMFVGAFVASLAATYGGRRRDLY